MPFWEKDHVKSYDDFARADNNDRSDAGILAAKAGRRMPGGAPSGTRGGTFRTRGPGRADHISVVLPSGETIKKKVKSNDTIRAIKQEVHNQADIPVCQQRIFYRGEELKDDRTLGSYSISKGSTLSLVVDESAVDDADAYRQQLLKDIEAITVDHIDRDPSNNGADNLRWATKSEQRQNQSPKNGLPGIVYHQEKVKGTIKPTDVYEHPDLDDVGVLEDGTVVIKDGNVWKVKEGLTRNRGGYVYFSHRGKQYRRNRFAMECYLDAKLTKDQIVDHMSGVRSNDSKANLRVFTDDPDGPSAAMMNSRNHAELNSNNTSGIRGVRRAQIDNRWYWRAQINNNIGHTIQKSFPEEDDGYNKAIEQRAKWVKEFGYYNS